MRLCLPVLILTAVASCGPNPQLDVVPKEQLTPEVISKAMQVQLLPEGGSAPVKKIIGPATGVSCKNKTWDKPANKGDALIQLRIKASQMGANAVTSVLYDEKGTDTWGTNCWESVIASGDAVVIR